MIGMEIVNVTAILTVTVNETVNETVNANVSGSGSGSGSPSVIVGVLEESGSRTALGAPGRVPLERYAREWTRCHDLCDGRTGREAANAHVHVHDHDQAACVCDHLGHDDHGDACCWCGASHCGWTRLNGDCCWSGHHWTAGHCSLTALRRCVESVGVSSGARGACGARVHVHVHGVTDADGDAETDACGDGGRADGASCSPTGHCQQSHGTAPSQLMRLPSNAGGCAARHARLCCRQWCPCCSTTGKTAS